LRKIAAPRSADPGRAILKRQALHYGGRSCRAKVYDRAGLFPGARLRGPALVADFGSTTFLPPGFSLRVDAYLNLILREDGRR
jgi:N-methylhydantoinase A